MPPFAPNIAPGIPSPPVSPLAQALVLIMALLLALLPAFAFSGCGVAESQDQPQDLSVKTVAAAVKQLDSAVDITGVLAPNATATVASKMSGAVLAVNASVGERVSAGDVLVSLDAKELNAQLASAKAAYNAAKSQSELAKVNLDAAQSGLDVTQSAVGDQINAAKLAAEAAKSALDAVAEQSGVQKQQSKLQIEQAQIGIQNAQNNLKSARDSLEIAQKNYDRTVQLIDAEVSPQANLDSAQTSLNAALAGVNSAQSGLDQAETALKTAEASYNLVVQSAKTTLDAAQSRYESAKAAYEQAGGSGAQGQMVAAQSKVDAASEQYRISASAGLEQAQAAIDSINVQLTNTQIYANISGVVVTRGINAGEIAAAGAPLFTLADVSKLKLKGTFSQEALPYMKEGLKVDVIVDIYPDKAFPGTVTGYGPIAVSTSSYFPCEITIDNSVDALAAGVSARAQIHIKGNPHVAAPNSAVVQNNGQHYVFVIKDGVAHKTDVLPGLKNDEETEILRGLDEGDELAVTNVNTLFDQMPVNSHK